MGPDSSRRRHDRGTDLWLDLLSPDWLPCLTCVLRGGLALDRHRLGKTATPVSLSLHQGRAVWDVLVLCRRRVGGVISSCVSQLSFVRSVEIVNRTNSDRHVSCPTVRRSPNGRQYESFPHAPRHPR